MKFKFLKIVLTGLIVLASTSIKIVHARPPAPIISEFEWEATCYDCKGELGKDTGNNYTTVNAILTLSNIDSLESEWWGIDNFVSFTYTADSDHLLDFVIYNKDIISEAAYGTVASDDSFAFYIDWWANANTIEKAGGYDDAQVFEYSFSSSFGRSGELDRWSISRNSGGIGSIPEPYDFGSTIVNTSPPPINASAPSSILIFALGLMGLSLRRSKKQV
jgi:hypothetical protein